MSSPLALRLLDPSRFFILLRLGKPGMYFVGLASPSRRGVASPARSKLHLPRLCSGLPASRYESLESSVLAEVVRNIDLSLFVDGNAQAAVSVLRVKHIFSVAGAVEPSCDGGLCDLVEAEPSVACGSLVSFRSIDNGGVQVRLE